MIIDTCNAQLESEFRESLAKLILYNIMFEIFKNGLF